MKNFKQGVVYEVTKDSTDGTVREGDIIWFSNDTGSLNLIDVSGKQTGFITKDDFTPTMLDFQARQTKDLCVKVFGNHEICYRKTKVEV